MTTIAIGVTVLLLVHIATISLGQCFRRLEDTNLSQQRLAVLTILDGIKFDLSQAEAKEHAYVWSGGKPEFLQEYNDFFKKVDARAIEMNLVLHGRHRMMSDEVKDYLRVRKECSEEVIGLMKTKGQEAALARSRELGEDMVTKHINVMIDELASQADLEFRVRAREMDEGSMQTVAGITLLMSLALIILVVVIAVVNQYVNERQKAERSLTEAERRFRAVFNQTFQFSGLLSPDGSVIEANHTALEFARVDARDVKDKPFWETPWWSHSEDAQNRVRSAIASAAKGETVRLEEEVAGPGGRAKVDFSVKPVKEEDGRVVMLIAEARDISERVLAEEAIAEREARMRAIVETAPDGIITVNSDGTIESINSAMERLFGYKAAEIIGKDINEILPSLLSAGEDGKLARIRTGERRVFGVGREFFGIAKDGTKIPVEVALSVINLGNQQILTGIVRDVTERREADMRVKDFYSTVSHELRTPLTAIRTALGLMENSFIEQLSSPVKPVLDIASQETDRLIRMVNDILDIRKIESGKLDLKLRKLRPADIVDRVVGSIQSLAHESRVRLEQVIETPEWLLGDEDRLQQVLTNLLSNAIKWSPEDSVVRVVVTDSDGRVRFEIQDKGPGIPEEEVDKLFGRFQQVSTREERSRGGTGLGLAIAKAIVEQHGGAIGVFVKDGVEGSNFWFEVPVAEATVKSGTFKARAAKFAFHDTDGVKVSGQNEKVSAQSSGSNKDDSDKQNALKLPAEKEAVEVAVSPESKSTEASSDSKTDSNGKAGKKSSRKKVKK